MMVSTPGFIQSLQKNALEHLTECHERFDEGDRRALMRAIYICATYHLPMPAWVAKAYIDAYIAVLYAEERSWDQVFGKPYPKGTGLKALRDKRDFMYVIHKVIIDLVERNPGTAINVDLFEAAGEQFGIGSTRAQKYYREACKTLGETAVDVKKRKRK